VISGRNVFNFQEIYDELEDKRLCVIINDEAELEKVISDFLKTSDKAKIKHQEPNHDDNIAKKIVKKITINNRF
jgi:3-deoxy-D-manno-octulosonic-acid transferase